MEFTVHRYENETGIGPYRWMPEDDDEFYAFKSDLEDVFYGHSTHPTWRRDFAEPGISSRFFLGELASVSHWTSGFISEQQAIEWFKTFSARHPEPQYQWNLEYFGFELMTYQTSCIEFGKSGKQIRFLKKEVF